MLILQRVSAYLIKFPGSVSQVSFAHLDDPPDGEMSEICSLEESHEHSTENCYGVPGVRSHNLFGNMEMSVEMMFKALF